jgi:hypothetical protein
MTGLLGGMGSYGISGDKRFREHEELDVIGCGFFDERNRLLDGGGLVHEHRCCVSCSHLEFDFLLRCHGSSVLDSSRKAGGESRTIDLQCRVGR